MQNPLSADKQSGSKEVKNKDMNNFGFISKKKVAKEIARIYNSHNNTPCPKERFLRDCEAQSSLNLLCTQLNIKPMHLSKLGGGTGEMIGGDSSEY